MKAQNKIRQIVQDVQGRVLVPIVLYFLGVPGIICILLWAFFFRNR